MEGIRLFGLMLLFLAASCDQNSRFSSRRVLEPGADKATPGSEANSTNQTRETSERPPQDWTESKTNQHPVTVSEVPPASAVKKGSFTVYTEPENPLPGHDYSIIILVDLPSGTIDYELTDLSGMVVGTDSYTQAIGSEAKSISQISGSGPKDLLESILYPMMQKLIVKGDQAILQVPVPGAERLVRDIITVHSKLLNEQQTIEIEF